MEIDLAQAPDEPAWPEGISVRTLQSGEEHAVYDAIMDAFADHWDFVPTRFEDWEQFMVQSPTFDPSLWFIAEDGDEIAGFSLCRSERRPGIGHVGVLGVRPPWRRRGLGRPSSFTRSMNFARAAGKADLGVDAENTTNAVGLYERAGMHSLAAWTLREGARMSVLRGKCPYCKTYTAVAIGPGYECHACGREFAAGLVRVPRAWGTAET